MWKFMMAKCQQMDLYIKTLGTASQWGRNEPFLNYNPNGWNKFEDDALILGQSGRLPESLERRHCVGWPRHASIHPLIAGGSCDILLIENP
jgi:hypothetical protein